MDERSDRTTSPRDRHKETVTKTTYVVLLALGIVAVARADVGHSQPYVLEDTASFQEGCFTICACPVLLADDLSGSFNLTLIQESDQEIVFAVDDVAWFEGILDLHVSGSGTYTVIHPGTDQTEQRLVLDLQINEGPVEQFDSGLVPGSAFPVIDLTIWRDDMACYDQIFVVQAIPAHAADLNVDGAVDSSDLAMLLGSWGACAACGADLNGDAWVDASDLAMLLGGWSAP